jgi:hypothetical protein
MEMRELVEGWKETDAIHGRVCEKVLRIHRFATNGVVELEFRRDSRKDDVLCSIVKYWATILQVGKEELVRGCCE